MRPLYRAAVATSCVILLLSSGCGTGGDVARSRVPHPQKPETGSKDDPDARDRWFWEQRVMPAGSIPARVHREAVRHELRQPRAMTAADAQWSNLGPAPLRELPYGHTRQDSSGRALAIAIHPDDPSILLLGTAQGGVWKSTDRGATFRSIREETLPSLAINILLYHPDDSSVVFAGTGEPNGSTSVYGAGLLRSDDGGESWNALPSQGEGWDFDYTAITGLKFDARDPRTMYLTTATVVSALSMFRAPEQPQTGLFRSTDGGMSWTRLLSANRYLVGGSPTASAGFLDLEYGGAAHPDLLIVSEMYGGLLKSVDGGTNWTRITPQKASGLGAFPAPVPRVSLLDLSIGGYRLVDRLTNPDDVADFRRIELGMSSDPSILYAGYDSSSTRLDMNGDGLWNSGTDRLVARSLLFRSVDGGSTWSWLGSQESGVPDYCAGQCYYDNVVTVNPEDPDDVLIGGSAVYASLVPDPEAPERMVELPWRGMIHRSTDGGDSWIDLTPHCTRLETEPWRYVAGKPVYACAEADPAKVIHPDIHEIVFGPSGEIYVANDGGLYRGSPLPSEPSRRRRAARSSTPWGPFTGLSYRWENLNEGLSTLQFYRVTSHPTNPDIIIGGMQDNSCGYWDGEGWDAWGGGDGTVVAFDPKTPSYVYIGYQYGVARHDQGGTRAFEDGWVDLLGEAFFDLDERASFIPVFVVDPVEPSVVYAASTAGLFRSFNRGDSFTRLLPGQQTDGALTSVSVSPVDHRVVWGGTSNGRVYRHDIGLNGTAQRSLVSADLPERWVSEVAAGHAAAGTVYVVFNGYDANTPGKPGKVFVSHDSGATWTNISGDLPDIPVTGIALDPSDPNRIWIATDIAVFSTTNHGANWISERRNMPIVGVQDLHYNHNTGYLVAGTHGRGVWRLAVDTAATAR